MCLSIRIVQMWLLVANVVDKSWRWVVQWIYSDCRIIKAWQIVSAHDLFYSKIEYLNVTHFPLDYSQSSMKVVRTLLHSHCVFTHEFEHNRRFQHSSGCELGGFRLDSSSDTRYLYYFGCLYIWVVPRVGGQVMHEEKPRLPKLRSRCNMSGNPATDNNLEGSICRDWTLSLEDSSCGSGVCPIWYFSRSGPKKYCAHSCTSRLSTLT